MRKIAQLQNAPARETRENTRDRRVTRGTTKRLTLGYGLWAMGYGLWDFTPLGNAVNDFLIGVFFFRVIRVIRGKFGLALRFVGFPRLRVCYTSRGRK